MLNAAILSLPDSPMPRSRAPSSPSLSATLARRVWLALGCCLSILPAHAGRPLATDDAGVVEHGACQFELWTERGRDSRAHWLNPGCNPFGHTEFQFGAARTRESGEGSYTVYRWQIKQRLREYDETQFGLALALGQQRQHQLGTRESFVNGIISLPLSGPSQLLHFNLGGARERKDTGHRNRATWGLAFDTELRSDTRLSLESFGRSGERANWQLGLRHQLVAEQLQIDVSIGSAWGRWSNTRFLTLGLVWVSPAYLR